MSNQPQLLKERPVQRAARFTAGFAVSRGGNTAVIFALLLPVLFAFVGGAVDYSALVRQKQKLQGVADAAAVAGAKELSVADPARVNVSAVVNAVVSSYIAANGWQNQSAISTTATIVNEPRQPLQVQVALTQSPQTFFKIVTFALNANAVAVVVGTPNVCVLALDPSSMGTIYMQKNAKVIGNNCGVFSNSTHPNGIKAFNSSVLNASVICSAGGHAGSSGNFMPAPIDDCPQFIDPLSSRPEPAVAVACTATNLVIVSQAVTLSPGTYCGGINIGGSAVVTFDPGIYVIKDGPLYVDQTATVSGTNAGFYFTGPKSRFFFNTGTTVDLTAPKDGDMAGILFFGARSQSGLTHEILSDNAHNVLGTIYLPTGKISIDSNQPIADKSAYTAIVAWQLLANSGPTITLNTNYGLTDVPVPDGIRGAGEPVSLRR